MHVAERFHAVVDRLPETIALRTDDWTCSYARLDALANAFAHEVHEYPPGPVLVHPTDSLADVAALLGILKTGRPYCVVKRGAVPDELAKAPVLDTTRVPPGRPDRPQVSVRPEAPAGIFSTSGSTGRPKGVVRSHRMLLHRVAVDEEKLGLAPDDRVSHLFQMSFGASVSDLFGALLKGATLCPAPSLEQLAGWIRRQRISVLHLPAGLLRELLDEEAPFPSVRRVVPSGRLYWTEVARARRLFPAPCRLVSQYSSTEASCVTWMFIDHDTPLGEGPVPVGRPVRDKEVVLLDDEGRPAREGEIVVRSRYLADGYWGDAEQTARTFRTDGLRTGDRGRLDADGVLHLLGRRDGMVKIRGHRIELDAVDHVLHELHEVREAVTAARGDRLVAYVVPRATPPPTTSRLREALAARLPSPMVPSAFVQVSQLPRTANGKVDYAALPIPDAARPRLDAGYLPPSTPREQEVAAVWTDVLGLDRVGRHDGFLELGGDSLKALRVLSRLGGDLPLKRLLENATVEEVAAELAEAPPPPAPRNGLSWAQLGLWLAQQAHPDEPLFNEPRLLRVHGPLSRSRLEAALEKLLAHHGQLRTRYPVRNGRPAPVLENPQEFRTRHLDFTAYADHERETAALAACRLEAARPFLLDHAPLLRALVCRLGPEDHLVLLVTHHLASDYQSRGIFLRHLSLAYAGRPLPLAASYDGYVARETAPQPGPEVPPLELAPRRGRGRLQTAMHRFELPWADIVARARTLEATPFIVCLTAFKALVHRCTGRDDIPVAAPFSQRSRAEWAELVGCLVAPATLTTDCSGNPGFAELLRRVRASVLSATPTHRPHDIMMLVRPRGDEELCLGPCRARLVPLPLHASRFELTFVIEEGGQATLEYRVDCWRAGEIERLASRYARLLKRALKSPDTRVDELLEEDPPLTGPHHPLPPTGLAQLVEAQAPDAVAVRHGRRSTTYGELDRLANGVAHHLLERCPDWRDRAVALKLPPGVEMIAAMLGVLKAGGAYLPLDPEVPEARNRLLAQHAHEVIEELPAPREDRPATAPSAEDLAYVLFTSGSTGTPRAVAVPQKAVLRLVHRPDYVELGPGRRLAHLAPLTFDAATFEIWGALVNGGTVVVVDRDEVLRPGGLRKALEGVDIAFVTTALLNTLVAQDPGTFSSLDTLLFGGEVADASAVRTLLRHGPPRRVVHVYGPTEATTFTTAHLVTGVDEEATTVPIGRPIANTSVQILDSRLRPVPHGCAGELCVGGPGLARGYLKDEPATERAFVERQGVRLYRTGDRALVDPESGVLHFLGRGDDQVKIRGHRVEPGEVQAALAAHPQVDQAFVTEHERKLVAYVVSDAPEASLREHLERLLPRPMLPDRYVALASLPLTANGKVDRRALPAPEPLPAPAAAETPLDRALAKHFAQVLGLESAGPDTHFFHAGGHSLLALELLARLERELGVSLPFRCLLGSPTVAALARALEVPAPPRPHSSPLVSLKRGLPERPPLVCLHGFRGTVLHLFGLADRLDPRQPVLGLEHETLERPDVPRMAARYAESLLAETSGPLLLFGHCAAGTLVLELANRLVVQGREVRLVVLLDAVAPAARRPARRWSQRLLGAMIRFRQQPAESVARAARLRLRWLDSWTRALLSRRGFTVQVPLGTRLDYVTQTTLKAFLHHQPQRYAGHLTLLRTRAMRDRDLGWADLCQSFATLDIGGDHTDPFHDPASVQELARTLEELIAASKKRAADEMS